MTLPSSETEAASGLEAVFAHIDANRQSFVERLLAYVAMPSISTQNIGVAEVSEFLVDELGRIGMDAQAMPNDGYPVVVARWVKKPGLPTVLLYGHYDVQPPEPLEAWTTPPFEPEVRNGRIYGRGVADNKGQHLAQILAIESFLAVEGGLPCNVVLVLEGEEENGSPHIGEFFRKNIDQFQDIDLGITADGSVDISGHPIIYFGVRGIMSFELKLRRANRPVHSGHYGNVVPNPAWEMVQLLASMKNSQGEITVEGFHDGIVVASEKERAAAAALGNPAKETLAALGLEQLEMPSERPFFDRTMFHPSLTINGLTSGYQGTGTQTIVPNEAIAKLDVRLVEGQEPDAVFRSIEAHVKARLPEVEIRRFSSMLPSKSPMDTPFVEAIKLGIRDAQGVDPILFPVIGGSLPDYVFTKTLGVPIYLVPYANPDSANHAADENLSIERFHLGIRTGAALLKRVSEAVPQKR